MFLLTGKYVVRRLIFAGVLGIVVVTSLSVVPGSEKYLNLIPFLGESEQNTITYRQQLFENSIVVIKKHPLFGSINYLSTPEMEAMRQGEGIIDIVNTYLQVSLESGLVGLFLFIGFFGSVSWRIHNTIRRKHAKGTEELLLGRALLATIAGIMFIIFTVSSISSIPLVYWAVAGLGVGFTYLPRQQKDKDVRPTIA